MSRVPSVPGVEVGASWLGGCEHALTAGALELRAVLHRTLGPGRAELPASRAVRDAERVGGTLPDFPAGTRDVRPGDWRMGPLAPGLVGSRAAITDPGTPVWHSPRTAASTRSPFTKECVYARRLPAGL